MFAEDQISEILYTLGGLNRRTRIYFGCDSVRKWKDKHWHATYATIVAIHKNSNNGCALFYNISSEIDYDNNASKPRMRLMNETYKVCEAYLQLQPYISEYKTEIHLDINTELKHGSSCVAKEASGYVYGLTGQKPKLKPDSFAASCGAHGIAHGRCEYTIRNDNHI